MQNDTRQIFVSRYFIKQLDDDEFKALYNLDIQIAGSDRTINIINQRRFKLGLPKLKMAQKI